MNLKKKIEFLINGRPEVAGDNTELLIAFYEACLGTELDSNLKMIMRQWKPEAIVRARRKIIKGNSSQYAEEVQYRKQYTPKGNYHHEV